MLGPLCSDWTPHPLTHACDPQTVSIWSSGGRVELTVQRYMALQAAVRPDWYQSLADGDTRQAGTSLKRIRKSVERTLAFLDQCLLLHHEAQVPPPRHCGVGPVSP